MTGSGVFVQTLDQSNTNDCCDNEILALQRLVFLLLLHLEYWEALKPKIHNI